jgi:hypothetical protein
MVARILTDRVALSMTCEVRATPPPRAHQLAQRVAVDVGHALEAHAAT